MKKYAIFLTAILLIALTGCGRLDLVIDEDGSGEGKYAVELTGMFSAKEVKEEIEKGIAKTNEKAGKEIIRLDKFEENDGKVNATVTFDSISALSGGDESLLVTVDDLKRLDPELLPKLIDVNNKKPILPEDITKIGDNPVVYFNMDNEMEITVTVPGNILYAAGGTVAEDNSRRLEIKDDPVIIVFEPSSNMSSTAWIVIVALLVVAAVLYFMVRNGLFKRFMSGGKGGRMHDAQ